MQRHKFLGEAAEAPEISRLRQNAAGGVCKVSRGGPVTYSHDVIYHDFLPSFLKNIYIYIGLFSGGLLQHFIGIAILTRFGEAC